MKPKFIVLIAMCLTILFSSRTFAQEESTRNSFFDVEFSKNIATVENLLNDPQVTGYAPTKLRGRMYGFSKRFALGLEVDMRSVYHKKRGEHDGVFQFPPVLMPEINAGIALLNDNDKVVAIVASFAALFIGMPEKHKGLFEDQYAHGIQTGGKLIVLTPNTEGLLEANFIECGDIRDHSNNTSYKPSNFYHFAMELKQNLPLRSVDRLVLETDLYYLIDNKDLFGHTFAALEKDIVSVAFGRDEDGEKKYQMDLTLRAGGGLRFESSDDTVTPYFFAGGKIALGRSKKKNKNSKE